MASVEVVATVISGLFAGGASFITVVEHPARMGLGPAFAIREFRPSLARAHNLMAGLALSGFLLGMVAWWRGGEWLWLFGGLALVANGPWTLALIRPINRALLDPNLDLSSRDAAALITRWGRFHSVRAVLGCIGFATFVMAGAPGA